MINPDATYLMLKALLTIQPEPLIATITQVSISQNKGGAYLSLFAKAGLYRFVGVYEESWHLLPPAIVAQGERLLSRTVVEDTLYNRDQCKRLGTLFDAYPPFEVVKTRYEKGEKKGEWYLLGVTATWGDNTQESNPPTDKTTIQPPLPVDDTVAPTLFENRAHAIDWAVEVGAYGRIEAATTAYTKLYSLIEPQTAAVMFTAWKQHIGVKLYHDEVIELRDKVTALKWAWVFCSVTGEVAENHWYEVTGSRHSKKDMTEKIRIFVESYDPFTL